MNRTKSIPLPMKLFAIFGLIAILSSSFAGGNVSAALAQDPTPPAPDAGIQPLAENGSSLYYYVDGQRINLTPSLDWVSVKFVSADASEQESATGKFSSTVVSLAGARQIPHLGLTLLPLQDGLGTKSLVQGVNSMRASPTSFSQVNPVYAYDGVDMVVSDEFVAAFPPTATTLDIAAINAEHGVEVVSSILGQENTFVLRVTTTSAQDALAMANLYQESSLALYAAPNFVRLSAASPAPSAEKPTPVGPMFVPDDSYYVNDQWYLNNTQQYGAWMTADADIDAPEAWDITKGDPNIVIAIIDEGVDLTHIDLSGNLIAGYDATELGSAGAPSGDDAHGTAVAGIAAADSDNAEGIAGVCQLCKIMPVRIGYDDGAGGWTTDAWLANGITWAYTNGADILNNSWAGGSGATVVNTAITNAVTLGRGGTGSVVLFSAGNDNNSSVSWPASQSNVIAVGALNMCDQRKNPLDDQCGGWEGWGSNFGAALDVMAAGVWLTTTDIMGNAGYSNSSTPTYGADYTGYMNGTSGATPIVSGVVGLMLSINQYMTPAHVQEVLQATADDLGTAGWDADTGYGRANAAAAVAAAQKVDLVITGYELRNEAKTEVITNPSANESFWIRMTIKNRGGTDMSSFYPGVFLDGKPNYGADHKDLPAYSSSNNLGDVTNFSDYRSTATASAFNNKGCLYYDPDSLIDPLTETVNTERGNYTLSSFIPELPLNTSSAVDVHIAYPAGEFPDLIYDTIRTGLSAGTYPIYLYADPGCQGAESFEDNNVYGPIPVNVGVPVDVTIGSGVNAIKNSYAIGPRGRVTPMYPGVQNGPVEVMSTDGTPFFTSERALYGSNFTFNEVMGYPDNQLTNHYWFPWYDNKDMMTWVLVGNPSATLDAHVTITIGSGVDLITNSYTIEPRGRITPMYPGVQDGPVEVVSDIPVFTSERALYGSASSFNEVMGYPDNQLTNHYWFPWYDNKDMMTWVLVGNPSATLDAHVTITIGSGVDLITNSYTIEPRGRITPMYSGVQNGPVEVVSDIPVFTSERALYGPYYTFNEVMGYPDARLNTHYYFTWYDNKDMKTWMLVGNPSATLDAHITITIGSGSNMVTNSYIIDPKKTIIQVYPGVQDGPVEVLSDIPVVTSEMAWYGSVSSFNEVMGYPANRLTDHYWFPWYDGKDMLTWVLIGTP